MNIVDEKGTWRGGERRNLLIQDSGLKSGETKCFNSGLQ